MSTTVILCIIGGGFLFCIGLLLGLAGHKHEVKVQSAIEADMLRKKAVADYQQLRREYNDLISELTLAHVQNDEKDTALRALTAAHEYLYATYRGEEPAITDRQLTTAEAASLAELVTTVNDNCA